MGLLDALFGCPHKKLSFPITVRGSRRRMKAASITGTYVVCLDCGHEFPYDWNEMKVIREWSVSRAKTIVHTAPATPHSARRAWVMALIVSVAKFAGSRREAHDNFDAPNGICVWRVQDGLLETESEVKEYASIQLK